MACNSSAEGQSAVWINTDTDVQGGKASESSSSCAESNLGKDPTTFSIESRYKSKSSPEVSETTIGMPLRIVSFHLLGVAVSLSNRLMVRPSQYPSLSIKYSIEKMLEIISSGRRGNVKGIDNNLSACKT